ncbi:MAG: MFS family permease [Enterobacterales bacterium]|jgi:MFS family permease
MNSSSKNTIYASTVLSLCLVSDSLLYLLLPLYFSDFGVTIVWVGILLSVNRLVRILFQPWIHLLYEKLGVKNTLYIAILLASSACLIFVSTLPIYWLIFSRILWGIAYSLMRMCCLFIATQDSNSSLKKLAWYSSIQEIGPLIVLLLAPWLIVIFNIKFVMIFSLFLCFIAIPIALKIKHLDDKTSYRSEIKDSSNKFLSWNADYAQTLVISILHDGLWVIALASLLFVSDNTQADTAFIVAMFYVLRRTFNLVLGIIHIKFSYLKMSRNTINFSILLLSLGGFLIYLNQIILGSLIAISGRSLYMLHLPKILSDEQKTTVNKKKTINAFTLCRDIGSAIGTLIAGFIISVDLTQSFFLFSSILSCFILMKTNQKKVINIKTLSLFRPLSWRRR